MTSGSPMARGAIDLGGPLPPNTRIMRPRGRTRVPSYEARLGERLEPIPEESRSGERPVRGLSPSPPRAVREPRPRRWPHALALGLAAGLASWTASARLPKAHLVTQPVGAVLCWALSATLLVGSRVRGQNADPASVGSSVEQSFLNVGSLVLWNLPILLRSGAPLVGAWVGMVPALAIGTGVALFLCALRSRLESQVEKAEEAEITLQMAANAFSYLSLITPLDHQIGRGVTLFATLAGIYSGFLEAGRPDARAALCAEDAEPDPNPWRHARDMLLTAAELAVRIAFAVRIVTLA